MDDSLRFQEAINLKARLEGINLSKLARDFKIPGGPSMIYQHASGRRPISLPAALAYATAFNCSLEDISPRLAKLAESAQLSNTLQTRTITPQDQALLDIFAGLTPKQREEEIQRLTKVKELNDAIRAELLKESA